MPELPEVETIVSDLVEVLPGKTVTGFDVRLPRRFFVDIVQPNQYGSELSVDQVSDFAKKLIGQKIRTIRRVGKLILIEYSRHIQVIHLRLTGQLIFQDSDDTRIQGGHPNDDFLSSMPSKASNFIWKFNDKSQLFFNDQRKFGYLHMVQKENLKDLPSIKLLGVDALSKQFDIQYLKDRARRHSRTTVKEFICDQRIVTGIGNIYSDEALYIAKIQPQTRLRGLKSSDFRRLHDALIEALKLGIAYRGTSAANYLDSHGREGTMSKHLMVYRRYGKHCKVCTNLIKSIKLGGRTSSYCSNCQIFLG
jgi:formamidopyrimidine-DNA glycosylase